LVNPVPVINPIIESVGPLHRDFELFINEHHQRIFVVGQGGGDSDGRRVGLVDLGRRWVDDEPEVPQRRLADVKPAVP
jgi:hypothetical protein